MKKHSFNITISLILAVILIFSTVLTVTAEEIPEKCPDGHVFSEWSIVEKPTYDKQGLKLRKCINCEETETEIIAKLQRTKISKCSITGIKNKVYTGKAITQSITVKSGSKTLKSGHDYSVKYKNNTKYGTASITVTGKGDYTGSVTKTFNITPKSTSVTSLKSSKTMQFTVYCKKVSAATGYQVQYSLNKDMSSPKYKGISAENLHTTVRGLKSGKKYYIRVRCYKTVNGTKIYSSYSSIKEITTKKSKVKTSSKNVICLTFDDGPSTNNTPKILNTLKDNNIKATFFILNYSKTTKPIVKRMIAEGHTVGIHGYTHDYSKIYCSQTAFLNNITKLQNKLNSDFGYKAQFIRFPGGSSNTVSCRYKKGIMSKLTVTVGKKGYTYFDWNVSSEDATGNTVAKNKIITYTEKGLKKNRTNVVLMHDCASKTTTAASLQSIIDYANDNGYVFTAITEKTPQIKHHVNN